MSSGSCIVSFRVSVVCFLVHLFSLLPGTNLFANVSDLEPLRLSFSGATGKGPVCEQHGPPSETKKGEKKGGRPPAAQESEHRPVAQRTYYFGTYRKSATVAAYVRRPDGKVINPELTLGYKSHVSFPTPFGNGSVHGANNVYVVEQGVDDEVLTIRAAKWITMHHNCGWGHDNKFDETLINPQPLKTIPLEIVIDKLWDPNFHFSVASGDILQITVLSYGKPVSGATVVLSSEKGWNKEVVTDKDGKAPIQMIRDYYPSLWAKFKRTHRGEFLVTAHYNAEQKGSFDGDAYQRASYTATLPWKYSPSLNDYASYSYGLALALLAMTVSGFGIYIYREHRKKPYKGISFDE
jgi:hypothetical protein